MSNCFQPLSAIAPDQLQNFLLRTEGEVSPELTRWKYFDERFNCGRERGYVWLQGGDVRGFVGLIPFRARQGEETIEGAWTCDWSLQYPDAKGGIGVMLLAQALRSYRWLYGLGGNSRTQRLFPRLACLTVADAALLLHLPLRFGMAWRILGRVAGQSFRPGWPALNRIPLRFPPRRKTAANFCVEPGVSPRLAGLLAEPGRAAGFPLYDYEYVDWQIGRCPALQSYTCLLTRGPGEPSMAVLLWSTRQNPVQWRAAVFGQGGAPDDLQAVLRGAIRLVWDQGGEVLSILVSRLEQDWIAALRRCGFLTDPRRRPFYAVTRRNSPQAAPEMSGLSFLATDLAYRFY